eukprot:TRINITY_DN2505_c0_g1_i1.p1 TRINITY_DN2505_c0_g1~~TRINITY_DN2505_c0_g1_i1.p1  ORF type:complete len:358 (-),score=90.92 TRINITY_DN2505_c0_g1_i1:1491-2564(-)
MSFLPVVCLLLFFLGVSETSYRSLEMSEICRGDKAVVTLGVKALLLHLNITHLRGDFTCHLELEVSKGFGFHVYIQEMNFQGSESSNCKEDFLQFARDVLFFTTHSSPKYCGLRPKLNYTRYPLITPVGHQTDQARMYVEKKDSEMDVWVRLASQDKNSVPRNLTLVVTPFKRRCRKRDPFYRTCSHSQHCVHKDYFCDEYVNCAWPGGDVATDEVFCKRGEYVGGSKDPYGSIAGDASDFYNIPLIIVVLIILLFGFVALAYGLQVFFRRIRKVDEVSSGSVENEGRSFPPPSHQFDPHQNTPDEEQTELYEGSPHQPLRSLPSAPPSYEDVISNQALMPRDDRAVYDPPPSYTPS